MKTNLRITQKPRTKIKARRCATKEPRTNDRQVLDCGSPLPLSNRNGFVQRGAKRQGAGAFQDASRPRQIPIPHPPSSILSFPLSVFCLLLSLFPASAATRYVWQDSPSLGGTYSTWTTAANREWPDGTAPAVARWKTVRSGPVSPTARADAVWTAKGFNARLERSGGTEVRTCKQTEII